MAIFDEKGLFLRDLSEVHLLFDFISGRAGKSLDQLNGVFKFNLKGKVDTPLTSGEVVEEICKIRYPPEGQIEANAEQAAFMVVVKDKLNDLAFPARGLTIAFTSMFAGTALEMENLCDCLADFWCLGGARKSRGSAQKARLDKSRAVGSSEASGVSPSSPPALLPQPSGTIPNEQLSSYSAVLAFPNLEVQARKFRRFYSRLPYWGALLVLTISFVSWDSSVTTALVNRISSAEVDRQALFASGNRAIPTPVSCAPKPSFAPAPNRDLTAKSDSEETDQLQMTLACEKQSQLSQEETAARGNLRDLIRRWFIHPVALGVWAFTPEDQFSRETCKASPPAAMTVEDNFSAVLNTFNTVLVPLLFGWLGTLVAVSRSITAKVRDSTLAPRDHQLARISMFLGMSAGLTVGLFYNPADANNALMKNIGGTIPVSAAALSFLAGVGAEAFFSFLDAFISRTFPANTSPPKDASVKTVP